MSVLSTPHGRLLVPSPRDRFLRRLGLILGNDRLIWTPDAKDGLTTAESSAYRRTLTHSGVPTSRISARGRGYALSFAAASSQYITTPDVANLSFGNGAADQAFSIIALANTNDTAAGKTIVSKFTTQGSNEREWIFDVLAAEALRLLISDDSAGVNASTQSGAASVTAGWHLLGATYTAATGGATAGNDMVLYIDGASVAVTPTNSGSYVAMEDKAAAVEIGSRESHTANFFDGSLALVAVARKALSAADHAAIYGLCRPYFGI